MQNGINNCHYRDCEAITDNLSQSEKKSAEIFGYCAASPKITESGRSMIEMLGVLAIVGVLSVGGIAGYSKAMNQIKINKTISQIMQAYANIQTMCHGPCFGNVLAGPMPTVLYPDDLDGCTEWVYKGTKVYNNCTHALGGYFNLSEELSNNGEQFFAIGINIGQNKEACVQLATYDWNFDGFDSISIDTQGGWFSMDRCTPEAYNKSSEDFVEGDAEHIVKCDRITPAEAAYYCSNCSEDNGCGIVLTYYY